MTTDIVTTLLVNTIVFSVLFGFILVLRKLLSGRISAVMQCALLAIAVLKLVIPFGFESTISPLGWIGTHSALAETVQSEVWQPEPYAYTGTVRAHDAEDTITSSAQTSLPDNAAVSSSQPETTQASAPAVKTAPLHWSAWVCIVWLAGVTAITLWLVLSLRMMRRRIRHTKREVPERIAAVFDACKKELGIKGHIRLAMQTAIPVPAVTGVMKPMLIVPDRLTGMDAAELRNIFLHELTHYKRGDLIAICMMNGLNCLYWFNPLVWLCFKTIRNDMETICDQRCLRLMDADAQSGYIDTVLQFAGLPSNKRLQAAMTITDGRTNMEKRIHNMFKNRRTGGPARILVMLVAAIMLITCVLTACQPTPDEPVIVNKNDGQLEEKMTETGAPVTAYEAPDYWQETVENDKLKIQIDTDVVLPDVNQYPAVRLEPVIFTQERVDELVEYFAQGRKLYEWTSELTKDYYEEQLIEAKRGQLIDGEYVVNDSSRQLVEELKGKIANAPAEKSKVYTDTTLRQPKDFDGNVDTSAGKNTLDVTIEDENGDVGRIFIRNYVENHNTTEFTFLNCDYQTESMYRKFMEDEEGMPPDPGMRSSQELLDRLLAAEINLPEADAADMAQKVIADLGIQNMQLTNTERVLIDPFSASSGSDKGGYVFEYIRQNGGIPGYWRRSWSSNEDEEPPAYREPFIPEVIEIVVTDDGVQRFCWSGCAQVIETVSDNVEMLPFEKIQEALKDQIFYECSFRPESDGTREITVNSAELHVGYISVKDDVSQAILVPVWIFETTETMTTTDGNTWNGDRGVYIFNAIDGGVIGGWL